MAIHFPEKTKQALLKGFDSKAETGDLFSHDLDMEFSGVRTVHVYSLATEPLQDYDRSANPATGSRYGTPKDVGDRVQTFDMTQDRSLPLVIDKGNNLEQFNMKKAADVMKAERDEHISPELDKYRLKKWAADGGIHMQLPSGGLTKSNIVSQILDLHNAMLDAGVPDSLTLLIRRDKLPTLKLSTEWVGLDSLGGKTLPKGTMGEFDGMAVRPITSNRMPANVQFMILFKGSVIAPMKINTFNAHKDPPGLSGDLLEFRMIHDAFVLGTKADGVGVAVDNGFVAAAPTGSYGSGKVTLASTTGDAVIKYTTDGSDPRYSTDAKTYSAPFAADSGTIVKACAEKNGLYRSNLTTYVAKA